jgi:hypothetical protein
LKAAPRPFCFGPLFVPHFHLQVRAPLEASSLELYRPSQASSEAAPGIPSGHIPTHIPSLRAFWHGDSKGTVPKDTRLCCLGSPSGTCGLGKLASSRGWRGAVSTCRSRRSRACHRPRRSAYPCSWSAFWLVPSSSRRSRSRVAARCPVPGSLSTARWDSSARTPRGGTPPVFSASPANLRDPLACGADTVGPENAVTLVRVESGRNRRGYRTLDAFLRFSVASRNRLCTW